MNTDASMSLGAFNAAEQDLVIEVLCKCCHSHRWANRVARQRPFASYSQLVHTAEQIWNEMDEADYLEAFSHHPKIGDMDVLRQKYSQATREQGQVAAASPEVIQALYETNLAYENKFGFIFIVCASGKSAEQMLGILRQRIDNDRETELKNAAAEQAKITDIRLGQLFVHGENN